MNFLDRFKSEGRAKPGTVVNASSVGRPVHCLLLLVAWICAGVLQCARGLAPMQCTDIDSAQQLLQAATNAKEDESVMLCIDSDAPRCLTLLHQSRFVLSVR